MLATEDLRVFTVITAEGSFSRAARVLHLAQPSISDRIGRLERQVGAELFLRSNRGAELTAAGRRLLPYAIRCLALCDQAVRAVGANDAESRFRVLMHASYAPTIMPFVADVLEGHSVELSNNDAHSEEVIRAVSNGTADIGFCIAVPHPHNVRMERFYQDHVVCVAARDHPLAGRRDLTVQDVAPYHVAVNVWGDGAESFLAQLQDASIASTRLRPVSPAETAVALARLRGHVAVCTLSSVVLDLAEGRLVELPVVDLPQWVVEVFVVWRDADEHDGSVQALVKAIRSLEGGPSAWLVPQGHWGEPALPPPRGTDPIAAGGEQVTYP